MKRVQLILCVTVESVLWRCCVKADSVTDGRRSVVDSVHWCRKSWPFRLLRFRLIWLAISSSISRGVSTMTSSVVHSSQSSSRSASSSLPAACPPELARKSSLSIDGSSDVPHRRARSSSDLSLVSDSTGDLRELSICLSDDEFIWNALASLRCHSSGERRCPIDRV